MIQGDSIEYDLLIKWSKDFDCNGYYSCEIGVREGLGSKLIMDNVKNNYMHIGIDPYGSLKYQHYDEGGDYVCDYTDEMRDRLLVDMVNYKDKFHLSNMKDHEFMDTNGDKRFAFVHFDGPHTTRAVITEAIWFANRCAPHTRFVFDDHNTYQMSIIAHALTFFDFKTIEMGNTKCLLEKK